MIDAVSGVISRKPFVVKNPVKVDMSNSDSLDVSSGSTGYAGMMRGTSSAADTSVASASSGLTDIRAATLGVIGATMIENIAKPNGEIKPVTNSSEVSLLMPRSLRNHPKADQFHCLRRNVPMTN